MMDTLLRSFRDLLAQASADPTPGRLLVAWLGVTLAPLALVVPMTAVCLAAALLPAPWAAAVILGGVAANTALSWGLARTLFGHRLEAWMEGRGGRLASLRQGARRRPLQWAVLSRFLPVPFSAVPMVLASTGVGLGLTVLGSVIGMAPWTGVYIWVVRAGREGSLSSIGQAAAAVVLLVLLVSWARHRAQAPAEGGAQAVPEPLGLLTPRQADRPVVLLYTDPGAEPGLTQDARVDLAQWRDALGFEVEELPLDRGPEELRRRYGNHAPVAFLDGQELFNFKMDEHLLKVRLDEWRRRQGAR